MEELEEIKHFVNGYGIIGEDFDELVILINALFEAIEQKKNKLKIV